MIEAATHPAASAPAPSNSANGAMLSPGATMFETASGGFVDVAAPRPDTLRLYDIAQGMALTCRYGGQIKRFYSVAEHSVLVHDLLRWTNAPRATLIAALFHDAAEAYLGDVVAPLKYGLRGGAANSAYDQLADRMDRAIAERYGINLEALNSERLRVADLWALRIEARTLTHTGGMHWRWPGQLPHGGEKPASVRWPGGHVPPLARDRWLGAVRAYGIHDRPDNKHRRHG